MRDLADLIANRTEPLPALTQDERRALEQMARLVKAGAIDDFCVEWHRRDETLSFEARRPVRYTANGADPN